MSNDKPYRILIETTMSEGDVKEIARMLESTDIELDRRLAQELRARKPVADDRSIAKKSFADFQVALTMLEQLAEKASEKLSETGPDEISLHFGLELAGEASAIVGKVSAKGALDVTMLWRRSTPGASAQAKAHGDKASGPSSWM